MKHRQAEQLSQVSFSEDLGVPRGFIGYLQAAMFIAQSRSLKDRRRVVERLKQKAKNKFNVSVGEKPCQVWKNCELFFICANYTRQYALETIDCLEQFLRSYSDVQIVAIEKGVV